MGQVVPGSSDEHDIDAALLEWRQGDCALEEQWFAHVADGTRALTEEGGQANETLYIAQYEGLEGLVLVTQTCDVVRNCLKRPYVEVAPIVTVSEADYRLIERGHRPNYAPIPALADRLLVADLDRTMTVEKSVVATWNRTPGWQTDAEARVFAQALARKRARPAFPDDFVAMLERLDKRIREKHDRQSPEGAALRALREIRVRAAPDWSAETVHVTFWFILADEGPSPPNDSQLQAWLDLVEKSERYQPVEGLLVTLDDMTARDFIESDLLDFDHLSNRTAD